MTSDGVLAARWPDHLVDQIADGNYVLVVGAGITQQCTNSTGGRPPGWKQLLLDLSSSIVGSAAKRKQVSELVAQTRFLDAAEFIRSVARAAGKEEDFLKAIAKATDGGVAAADQFQPAEIHDTLMALSPTIVITTNYDKVLERATKAGFNVHHLDSDSLDREVRHGNPVIVKVHGTVDNASRIVITRSDYTRLRRQGALVLEVIEALFLTRTVLFVGYGLGDPDIQLLLENVLGARGDAAAHFMLTSSAVPSYQRDVYRYCYGTTVITYANGDYAEMRQMMKLLAQRVEVKRST